MAKKKWQEVKPISGDKLHIGCLTCSTASLTLSDKRILCAGFGDVVATRDGVEVYSEQEYYSKHPKAGWVRAKRIKNWAKKDPDHDWRIVFELPLHGETYQRHRDGKWYCIESNKGFA